MIFRFKTLPIYSAYVKTYMRNMFLWGSGLLIIICSGCDKREDLGIEALPEGSRTVLLADSLEVTTYTMREDSGRSDRIQTSLIGTFLDPVMGKVYSELHSQFLPLNNFKYEGVSPVADYAELSLNLKGYHGDASSLPQKFYVYRLTQAISKETPYYSSTSVSRESSPIGSVSFSIPLNLADSSVLKITLDKNFADYLLGMDSAKLKSSEEFLKDFKGLCISPDTMLSDTGAILKLDVISSYSKLRLFYHDATKAYTRDFVMNSGTAWFNHFSHTFSPYVMQQLTDTSNGKNQVLLQGMYGLKTIVKINNIERLKAKMPIAINKAELSMKLTNTNGAYGIPQNILLHRIDANSASVVEYNSLQKEFTANIPLYIQNMLEGKVVDKGFKLIINPVESVSSPASVILGGGRNASGYKMKIKIIYTKI
jgi:hypothetical protein